MLYIYSYENSSLYSTILKYTKDGGDGFILCTIVKLPDYYSGGWCIGDLVRVNKDDVNKISKTSHLPKWF